MVLVGFESKKKKVPNPPVIQGWHHNENKSYLTNNPTKARL